MLGTLAQHPELTTRLPHLQRPRALRHHAHAAPARAARAAGRHRARRRRTSGPSTWCWPATPASAADEVDRVAEGPDAAGWIAARRGPAPSRRRAASPTPRSATPPGRCWPTDLDDAAAHGRGVHGRRLRACWPWPCGPSAWSSTPTSSAETGFSVGEIHDIVGRRPDGRGNRDGALRRSPRRAAGPSSTPSWAPARCPTRTRSPRRTTSSSARRSSAARWLNVGRVEQLPRKGSYFTKELDAARTSVIVVRGTDGEVRAFHNICRHRGNKLVWNDYPARGGRAAPAASSPASTTAGATASRATSPSCSRSRSSSTSTRPTTASCPCRRRCGRGSSSCTSTPRTPSRSASYLGELGAGLEGYPFGEMTQVYKYRADVGANWKLFIDAFAEFYHAPVLHAKQAVSDESSKLQGYGFEALAYRHRRSAQHGVVVGRHVAAQGPQHGEADRAGAPQRPVRPVGQARHRHIDELPAGAQPRPPPRVGRRLVRALPELHAAGVGAELVPHVPLLADGLQPAHLRGHALLRAAEERHASACSRSSPR